MRGEVTNTIKVQYTPGSALRDSINKTLSNLPETADGGKTKVVELGGKQILAGLDKLQMFGGQTGCHMGQEKCNIADDQDCRVSRAVYETDCLNCLDQTGKRSYYLGTTGRTIHSRQREHQDSVRQKQTSNAMYKHHQTAHRGLAPRFQTNVKHGGIIFNLDILLTESIKIEKCKR